MGDSRIVAERYFIAGKRFGLIYWRNLMLVLGLEGLIRFSYDMVVLGFYFIYLFIYLFVYLSVCLFMFFFI